MCIFTNSRREDAIDRLFDDMQMLLPLPRRACSQEMVDLHEALSALTDGHRLRRVDIENLTKVLRLTRSLEVQYQGWLQEQGAKKKEPLPARFNRHRVLHDRSPERVSALCAA